MTKRKRDPQDCAGCGWQGDNFKCSAFMERPANCRAWKTPVEVKAVIAEINAYYVDQTGRPRTELGRLR